ncbi:hypothetical protein GCM10009107_46580 [Ideonella azotifigens]|uniref:Restriction system protein Mrr-like N-terminal domain-containing protein n=1 Tax=Ideonella azotifigens TaxID=513160 RepID=A0ABN1KCD1_9BURK
MTVARDVLKQWVIDALQRSGGEAHLISVARDIWTHHESDLREAGDLFFSWQYDMRWACTALRSEGVVEPASKSGVWTLAIAANT